MVLYVLESGEYVSMLSVDFQGRGTPLTVLALCPSIRPDAI